MRRSIRTEPSRLPAGVSPGLLELVCVNASAAVVRRLSVRDSVIAPSLRVSRAAVSIPLVVSASDTAPGTPREYPERPVLSSGRSLSDSATSSSVYRPSREEKLNVPAYEIRSA